ncbi:chloride channel protein [Oleidesulfovibrio alaskensis]|jgi:CIC family chloride channel protein|uniref:chloride channel protein n=1 Tax=Oleidesulfovibrio alaskensis TaxID=58180 RepID=UPI00040AF028|nr:chloride channel protein [Oleidesulfovibrio alaskensis]MBL3582918.1 chloride channel protein [Oleidesulfovibrio alaskensis]
MTTDDDGGRNGSRDDGTCPVPSRPFSLRSLQHGWRTLRSGRLARLDSHLPMLLMAVLVGVLGGYGAVLFKFVIKGVQFLFYGNTADFLEFHDSVPYWAVIAAPAAGGLAVGYLVSRFAREARGHGVPEVMEAIALHDGRIRKRVALVKIFASAISISSGGSVGREGPIVQIGSGIGSTVGQMLKVGRPQRRTLVGCGAAAGIAATFNAPVAGVLFALELLLGDFGLAAFSPVVLSSVVATTISRHYFGDFPAFVVPGYEVVSLWEYGIYPFLGIVCGAVAVIFVTVLYRTEDLCEAVRLPDPLKACLGGAAVGCMLLWFPHVFGVGYGGINLALQNGLGWQMMLLLVGVKIIATSVTIGSGGSGGVFAPSLFIGSMTGGFFGWAAGQLFPGITALPGAYALVAMGGLVAGTTHAPITAILIIFELTGDYQIILPLMVTCILATVTASTLKDGSIYTIKLLRRGVDIAGGMEQNLLRSLKVGEFMRADPPTIWEGTPLHDVILAFRQRDVSYLHVVDREGGLKGIISFRDLRAVLADEYPARLVIAGDIATTRLVTVTEGDSIQCALGRMSRSGIAQLPVVELGDARRLKGILREKDVIHAYDMAVVRRQMEHGAP